MEPLLPIEVQPADAESVTGYLLRLLALNGANVKEVLALHRRTHRKHLAVDDLSLFSALAGVPVPWFEHRTPRSVGQDRWMEFDLFGHRWRNDWLLRGLRQQVCPACIREHGFARMEWDLMPYTACHLHGIVLQDDCTACRNALAPDRPALEVCKCGHFLAKQREESCAAPEEILAWCSWLSGRVQAEPDSRAGHAIPGLPSSLVGTSPDGAYRLIHAFAGGPRAFRGERMESDRPWLSTQQVGDLVSKGLQALFSLEPSHSAVHLGTGAADGLAEQSVRGITAWDRAVAGKLLRQIRLKPRWRNVSARFQHQLNLFEEAL
jgi:hypothetical protein